MLKEMQFNDEKNEAEEREKKAFEAFYNRECKKFPCCSRKDYKMDGFKRKIIKTFDNTVVFDEVPNIVCRRKGSKKWDGWKGGSTYAAANLAWEAWMARASLDVKA